MICLNILSLTWLFFAFALIHGQFTLDRLKQLDDLKCDQPSVTVHVYSGTEDPVWTLNIDQLVKVKNLAREMINENGNSTALGKSTTRIMGYHGFSINCPSQTPVFINGIAPLEHFLLLLGRHHLPVTVFHHIKGHVGEIVQDTIPNYSQGVDCNRVPIRGPDAVPVYDPNSDDGGCFVKRQSENNCYAYGTDIVTNTFPQPGRGSGKQWKMNTCTDMGNASIRDGLVYNGTILPTTAPEAGHFAALLIWPGTNFHWIRMDVKGRWSHKPGGTPVRNVDNRGLPITDPSKSDFSPWTQFCAYYIAQPSKLTIK